MRTEEDLRLEAMNLAIKFCNWNEETVLSDLIEVAEEIYNFLLTKG